MCTLLVNKAKVAIQIFILISCVPQNKNVLLNTANSNNRMLAAMTSYCFITKTKTSPFPIGSSSFFSLFPPLKKFSYPPILFDSTNRPTTLLLPSIQTPPLYSPHPQNLCHAVTMHPVKLTHSPTPSPHPCSVFHSAITRHGH